MDRKRTKLIAIMLVFMLTITHFSIIGEVLANSLENQETKTNNANVEFDSYFKNNENTKEYSSVKTIGEENYLYTNISVKEVGYLKNIVVTLENANYVVNKEIENKQIAKIEENKIYYNQIKNGNTVEIALPIQMLFTNLVEELSKESIVKLTGIYVDKNGKEIQIEKEITVSLTWTGKKEANLNAKVSKFIPYSIKENKGIILQTTLQSYLNNNILPVKENKIEISVPTINNIKPEEVKVVANTTKATNGDIFGANFTNENYTYNKETNKLTITVQNIQNEQKQISWQKEAQDEFVITYIYKEEALNSITKEGIKVLINANSEITTYEANMSKVQKEFKEEVILKDKISNIVDFEINTNIESLSKGQIYANYQATNKIETNYEETITANIAMQELTDKIIIEQKANNFITNQDIEMETLDIYLKTITVDKKEINKILGEEGQINLYSGEKEVGKIDKQTKENKEGKIIIDLSNLNLNNLKIETSRPVQEGKINFIVEKAIKSELSNSKIQMKNIKSMKTSIIGKAINGDETFVDQIGAKEILFTEPTSKAELTISNTNLSTVVTNENVKLTAILKTDTLDCNLYQNPVLQITMPKYVENINIKNIEVLFDTEGTKLTLKTYEVVQNADDTKTIMVMLEGTQTEYTLGAISKGVNVVILADITIEQFTPNKQDKIKMVYTNSNVITRARTASTQTNETETNVNIVAPVGVITTSKISDYKENAQSLTSISGEEKIATVPILSDARNANFSMEVINNYNNTIDSISILGRTLHKGNKNILTGSDLGTTIDLPLNSNIQVEKVDASKVKVYYSENANATKALNLQSNGWTLTPENLANVKSYLIVLTNHTMNTGDRISFRYTSQIPANMQHNESAFENYVVYFNNNVETGAIVEDKQASTKIGLTTGRGPVLETNITSNIQETEEVLTGNIIKYILTVKNTGTETAENVVANINLPNELQYVELEENSLNYKAKSMQGQAKIELGNIEANKTYTKEIYVRAGILSALEDTKQVEVKPSITATNFEATLETNAVKNTLARTHFIITPTVLTEREILRENDSYTYYMEILASSINETREDTVLDITLPEEIEYESVVINNKIINDKTDITENTKYSYDKKTKKLTINLGNVNGEITKAISLNVKVGKLPDNVYDKQVNIEAKVSAKDSRTQIANIEPVKIGKVGFKITQSSNIPENTHITAGEDLKYIFTIENLSSVDLSNVKLTDILPSELTLNHMSVTRASGNILNSYTNSINISLKGKEKVTLEVNVSVNMLEETKTIVNKATIECEGINKIETSSYKHIIEKFDKTDINNPGGEGDSSNPTNKTKRIMGTVWLDKNANGQREEEETKIANVEVLLFNNQTGEYVTDNSGNLLKSITDENGTYTFSGITQGKYTVIYLYDVANYSATTYKKENVDSTINSDAVDSKITLDGVTRVVAITEEIVITDSNIYNIDLGLVENPKFDLKLDKTVSRIIVQDETGTKTYDYKDSKLAKRDLVGKQINNTTIIVEYKIKVSNEGAISGFVKKIVDYMPSEMKFNSELNKDWYTSENGLLYNSSLANSIINPGESKEVTLLLTKKMTEDNLGLYHNEAEIYESYNDLGIEDIDSKPGNRLANEDDISSADVLITLKTGETIMFVGLTITILTTIGIGAYFIKKKVLR